MSPIEVQKAWASFGEPLFKARAKQRQVDSAAVALAARGLQPESMVTGNPGNHSEEESVSLPAAARAFTGKDLDWLNKVSEIRAIAENEKAPVELRDAAQRGIAKLSQPNAPVEPVYKSLLKIGEAIRAKNDPETARIDALEAELDKLVTESTLLEKRLSDGLDKKLGEAARLTPGGPEFLRGVRVALTKSLASIVAVECGLTNDPTVTLNLVGGEVTRLLSEQSISLLGLEHEHGNR
ncbi:MAG: hypothetical protein GX862_07565 [Leucobacter sp.]|nr:hypothetical protein [Leucobacter sp.]